MLRAVEQELTEALGGNASPQERLIIRDIARVQLYLDSIDNYLMSLSSLVRKGRGHPLLAERARLAGRLTDSLKAIGLARRGKPALDLAQRLAIAQREQGAR